MTAPPGPPSARLALRLTPEHKALIERAARVRGQTVSRFATAALLKAAEEALKTRAATTFSARDADTFLEMLNAVAEPNAALKDAARRYKGFRGI